MEKLQPEGRHVPLSAEEPLYQTDYRTLRVFGMQLEGVTGKENLGQDRPPERTRKVVEGLFQRGKRGDLAAIEHILELSPLARPPAWNLAAEITLRVAPTRADIEQHARLVAPEYWRLSSRRDEIERSISHSTAWVGAHDASGVLIAAGRALSDGDWAANIYDVVVAKGSRGLGLGRAVMGLLLEHPRVKYCARQRLGTADAQAFYQQFGFENEADQPPPFPHTAMLRRGAARP
jgi:ribosomal protein S18 acetylase RimI-like enzyme